MVAEGVLDGVIPILTSTNAELVGTAVWLLGNIAGDCPLYRDSVVARITVQPFIELSSHQRIGLLRNVAWAISSLCRGKPPPLYSSIQDLVPVVTRLLYIWDEEILRDILWAICYLSEHSDFTPKTYIDGQ
jgi:hypothetical protein